MPTVPIALRIQGPRGFRVLLGVVVGVALVAACSGPRTGGEAPPSSDERVYHVQVHMTEDKRDAVRVRGRANEWWSQQAAGQMPPLAEVGGSGRVASIEWKAPLYRVRLGPFRSREQADTVLSHARSAFPDAFVVPDRMGEP